MEVKREIKRDQERSREIKRDHREITERSRELLCRLQRESTASSVSV